MDISSNDQDFTKVIDVYNETASVNVADEKGFITFVGKGSICIVAYDKEGTPFYIERTMDFSETTDEHFSPVKSCSVSVVSVSYRIKDDRTLEIRVEFSVSAFVTTIENDSFVEDVIVYEDKKIEKNSSALTLYFAEKGETVWEIGKRYSTDCAFIKEDNELEEETLPEKEMLIIRR